MLNQDISAGIFDRFRSLPMARWAPLAGAIMGDVTRYVISVVVTVGFGMVLGFRVTTNPFAAIAACLLVLAFALAMCWISALIGLLVKTPQGVQNFGFTAMFPIVFASGLLVPIQTMPGWLQGFAKANPMTLLAEASRGLMTSGPVAVPAGESMLWALGILVVFAPLAVRVYRRKT
jgi:oleandomycin transport system permease protein